MEKLRTTLTIFRHSLQVLGRNPRLLVFPLVSLFAVGAVYIFFFVPLTLHKSLSQAWHALGDPLSGWESLGPWHIAIDAQGNPVTDIPVFGLAVYYLIAMFVMTFINVALYSQIIAALNGGRVSVSRGLVIACARVPSIAQWSLFAGSIGVILRALQGTVDLLGKWILGSAGLAWSAASVFVIPVMINEPRTRSPFAYLKISTKLIRRVWGEGIIGLGGLGMATALVFVALLAIELSLLTVIEHPMQVVIFSALAGLGVFSLLYLAWQIFECGLYVYASEGVAPGSFDEKTFERVWTVTQGAARAEAPDVPESSKRMWPWLAVPGALVFALVLWMVIQSRTSPPQALSLIGRVDINIEELGYKFDLADAQATGLFVGRECSKCDFSPSGSWALIGGRTKGGVLATLGRHDNHLYIVFYGPEGADGEGLVMRTIDGLRSRFPGHEAAVTRAGGPIPYTPRTTVARWNPTPDAKSYTIEIDCYHCCRSNKWCTDVGAKWKIVPDLVETTYTFDWVGAQPGRWRIWSINADGEPGPKSGWTNFDYSW